MTPAETQLREDLASLNGAIASGVRSATIGGQTVTYNTTQSLILARNDLQGQINVLTGVTRRPRQAYAFLNGRGYE